ncbi:MAG: hypothetical protein EP348_03900 [Alphaproteobacteria bacterium]|nr:MAG: hypothetical protein EP348_03900 [Alphaproteobacteria bacterium]
MKLDLLGKPAFLENIAHGSLFYVQIGEHNYPCLKAFLVMNDSEIADYVVAFMPSERDRTHLPRLVEERTLNGKSAYRIGDPEFRPLVSEATLQFHTEYWPTPGIVIEAHDAAYLTVKAGRMSHKLMYLNISTGELLPTPPKAPFVFVQEWKIILKRGKMEQTLISFPPQAEPVRLISEAAR